MTKIPIAHQELSAKVLAAIHQHPKCESVKVIAITLVEIVDDGATWHVRIVDSGEADMLLASTVAREVTEDLEPLFELVN